MRAFCVRNVSLMSRSSLAMASSSKMWCSAEAKHDRREQATEKAGENNEEPVSMEAVEALKAELEDSKKALEEMKKELLYRAADAENARRIGREDVDKSKQYGITSFGKDMLEVADTLEKGVEAFGKLSAEELEANKSLNSIFTGVKLSVKILHKNMSKHGIEKMNVTVGTQFDHNFHEALVRMPASENAPAGTICHVLKDGYTIKDRILRAAQVGVSFDDNE